MSNLYLRVGSEWSLLFDPKDAPTYMINLTRTPIQFKFYSEETNTETITFPFTLGGIIGEACVPAHQYCYVKACPLILADGSYQEGDVEFNEDGDIVVPEGLIMTDDDPIYKEKVKNIEKNLGYLTTELMQLSNRLTDTNIRQIYHRVDYVKLVRKFLRAQQKNHYSLSHLQSQILSLRMRVATAQTDLSDIHTWMHKTDMTLEGFDFKSTVNDKVQDISVALGQTTVQVANLLTQVSDLMERMLEAEETGVELEILKQQFLNNAQEDHHSMTHLQSQILSMKMDLMKSQSELMDLRDWMATKDETLHGFSADNPVYNRLQSITVTLGQTTAQVSNLLSQVTNLMNRMDTAEETGTELALLRQTFLDNAQQNHYSLSHLQSQILSLRMRLFSAEGIVVRLLEQQANVEVILDGFDLTEPIGDKLTDMSVTLGQLSTQVANLLSQVLTLTNKVENIESGTGGVIPPQEFIEVQKDLSELHTKFTTLNNSIVTVASESTVDEVNDAYDALAGTVDPTILPVITTVKDTVVQLIENTDVCDKAVTTDSQLILDGELTDMIDHIS